MWVVIGWHTYALLEDLCIVRRQAKSRVFLMIKVAIKFKIVLQGRKSHFISGGKISGRSNRSYDPVRSYGGQISNLVKSVQNCY